MLIDPNHPFWRPLWLRILVVAICFAGAGFEFGNSDPFFGMIFAAMGAYALWMLLIVGPGNGDAE